MTNQPNKNPIKRCACTGVRWCASCRDPETRRRHKMDDLIEVPDFLQRRPIQDDSGLGEPRRISHFDPDTQSAPGCPAFTGIRIFPDFVSTAESDLLLGEIETTSFTSAQSGKLKQHYGPKINFNKKKMNAATFEGLPNYAHWIESRLRMIAAEDFADHGPKTTRFHGALDSFAATDAFVLRYLEKDASNLDFHFDDTFAYGELILGLSLESDSVLTFIENGDLKAPRPATPRCVRVPLPARSLMALYGEARFAWEHAILAYDIAGQRTSITLRTLHPTLQQTESGQHVLALSKPISESLFPEN